MSILRRGRTLARAARCFPVDRGSESLPALRNGDVMSAVENQETDASTVTRCPSCGGSDLIRGSLQSTGAVHFRPQSAKFLSFYTAEIKVHAQMCCVCGLIAMIGDTRRLRALQNPKAPLTRTPGEPGRLSDFR